MVGGWYMSRVGPGMGPVAAGLVWVDSGPRFIDSGRLPEFKIIRNKTADLYNIPLSYNVFLRASSPKWKLSCQCVRELVCICAMDKLEEIFAMQEALNQRIGVQMDGFSQEDKGKWILNYTRAMQQELAELVDSVPWKWWAKYQEFDEQNARVEVVDLFHFLISLAQTLGMTADDVYQAYVKKNKVNHERQDTGYVQKDESDSKHI